MSPLVAYHATRRACRDGIKTQGLLPGQPRKGRPYGVYVYGDDFDHPTFSRGRAIYWCNAPPQDVWQVAYIGPMIADHYVTNALILLEPVKSDEVTLVTRNK